MEVPDIEMTVVKADPADPLLNGTREDVLETIVFELQFQLGLLVTERDALDRSDPRGRHLSIAITELEGIIFRLEAVI